MEDVDRQPGPFRILVLCMANVCRSPLAADVLRSGTAATPSTALVVTSAGVNAASGEPMCDESAARAGERRHSHRSTGLTIDGLRRADLVLALDRTHATVATQLAPGCRPRMFTLRQAAELASTIIDAATDSQFPDGTSLFPDHPQERLRWLVDQLDSARGTLAEQPEGWEDIPDDHGETTHGATLDEVSTTAHRLAAALATVTAPAHPAPPTTV